MTTFLSWLSTNWLDLIKWVIIGVLVWYGISVHNDLRAAEKESLEWKQSYKTTADNLSKSEASIKQLTAEQRKIENLLVERETEVQQLTTDLSNAKKRIVALGRENETIRELLATVIPDELWDQIWSSGCADSNTDAKNQGACLVTPGVR